MYILVSHEPDVEARATQFLPPDAAAARLALMNMFPVHVWMQCAPRSGPELGIDGAPRRVGDGLPPYKECYTYRMMETSLDAAVKVDAVMLGRALAFPVVDGVANVKNANEVDEHGVAMAWKPVVIATGERYANIARMTGSLIAVESAMVRDIAGKSMDARCDALGIPRPLYYDHPCARKTTSQRAEE